MTAQNDDVVEGGHTGTISHSSASSDSDYAGLSGDDVTANITDNDSQQLTVSPTSFSVNEGSTSQFNVRLAKEPAGNQVVTTAFHLG